LNSGSSVGSGRFSMSNPWDPFPLPTRGDLDERLTFEGVGRVMSAWERIEFQLSVLHSFLTIGRLHQSAVHVYGAGRIFRDRLTTLRKGAERYFTQAPHQGHEGTFDAMCSALEKFADRRNEVAHGVVFEASKLEPFSTRFAPVTLPQFALIPPYHAVRSLVNGNAGYAYTSVELLELTDRLEWALAEVEMFRKWVEGTLNEWLAALRVSHFGQ
jgi:hypothetical protein